MDQENIDKVWEINAEVDRLLDQINDLLEPMCKAALAKGDRDEIRSLARRLPTSFWRSELLTYLIQLDDKEGK